MRPPAPAIATRTALISPGVAGRTRWGRPGSGRLRPAGGATRWLAPGRRPSPTTAVTLSASKNTESRVRSSGFLPCTLLK